LSQAAALVEFLNCPKCKQDVSLKDDSLSCNACSIIFPNFNGIPWFFKSVDSTILQWQARISALLQKLEYQKRLLQDDLLRVGLLPETKERLQCGVQGVERNLKSLKDLLSPLMGVQQKKPNDIVLSLIDKVPFEQTIDSYFVNIFRDWSWETDENQLTLKALVKVLPKDLKPQNIFFLGAGAGRLTYDLHQLLKPNVSVAVDINPLLMFVFKGLLEGKNYLLSETPIAPLTLKRIEVEHLLQRPGLKPEGISFLFADACNLPVKPKSIDCIVTSWFIDIVKQDFKDFAKRINLSLKKGGHWINFGPLGFRHTNKNENYVIDEVNKIVKDLGFEIKSSYQEDIPYLSSPNSGNQRRERVFCYFAEKIQETKAPAPFSTLPSWIQNPGESIPQPSTLSLQLSRHQLAFQILSTLDGKKSIDIVSLILSQHYKMPLEQAKEIVIGFLIEKFEH